MVSASGEVTAMAYVKRVTTDGIVPVAIVRTGRVPPAATPWAWVQVQVVEGLVGVVRTQDHPRTGSCRDLRAGQPDDDGRRTGRIRRSGVADDDLLCRDSPLRQPW